MRSVRAFEAIVLRDLGPISFLCPLRAPGAVGTEGATPVPGIGIANGSALPTATANRCQPLDSAPRSGYTLGRRKRLITGEGGSTPNQGTFELNLLDVLGQPCALRAGDAGGSVRRQHAVVCRRRRASSA